MRQGQHKSRSRNRGRRPSGSLNRVYESNGPDVKVRGTAQTVADKYLQLARDAQSGGDIVKAESYFQHAEHYLRIVAANQPANQPSQPQRRSPYDDDSFDDVEESAGGDEAQRPRASGGEREAEPEPEPERETAAAAAPEAEPDEPRPAAGEGDGKDESGSWDGHQPDFLRRGSSSSNGAETPSKSTRTRRERRPRTPQPELAGSEQPQIPAPEDGANTGENT